MKVSIITINYNNDKGLSKTIKSIVSQSVRDYEWIVIDGGSSDNSISLLEQNKDRFSYWVSEKDNGIYNAMNKGIIHATGDYIIFMNSGDTFLHSKVLQEIIPLLDKDIVAGSVFLAGTKTRKMSPNELTPWWILNNNIPHQAEFIRRSLFSVIGLYAEDLSILSDLEFNLRASLKEFTYKSLNYDVATVEPGGISSTQTEKVTQEIKCIQERNLPLSVCKDYTNWRQWKFTLNYPSINWAIQQRWPLKFIKILYSILGKR